MGFIPSSLENPGRTLSRFNGSSTISLGDVTLGHFGTRAKNQVALAPIQMVATPKCCKKRPTFSNPDGTRRAMPCGKSLVATMSSNPGEVTLVLAHSGCDAPVWHSSVVRLARAENTRRATSQALRPAGLKFESWEGHSGP